MKTTVKILLLPTLLFTLTISILAQNDRASSTAEERATAVKIARLLEAEPFHKEAKKAREWFTFCLIKVPDISIEVCIGYMEPIVKEKKNYSSEIFTQMMFSSAAFIIEHPDQSKDPVAVNLAGLEGALKTYESILKEKPKAKWEHLDGLISKREKGELRAFVEEVLQTKCKRKN
jgi:carboxypeptidase Q